MSFLIYGIILLLICFSLKNAIILIMLNKLNVVAHDENNSDVTHKIKNKLIAKIIMAVIVLVCLIYLSFLLGL